jgi:hypothetical protein
MVAQRGKREEGAKMMSEQGRGTVNVQELIMENRELRARVEELEKSQLVWHKWPEEEPEKYGHYLVCDPKAGVFDFSHYHAGNPWEHVLFWYWAEIPEPEGE